MSNAPQIDGCLKGPVNCCRGGEFERGGHYFGPHQQNQLNVCDKGPECAGWECSEQELKAQINSNDYHLALCDNCVRRLGLVW